MATLIISDIEVCDSQRNPFPHSIDPLGLKVYRVPYNPKIVGGRTGSICLKVSCRVTGTAGAIQAKFLLNEMNNADYTLLEGTQGTIGYFRQVKDRDAVFLDFESRLKKNVVNCLLSRLRLRGQDSAPNSPSVEKRTRVRSI